jgi:hypothetical protein
MNLMKSIARKNVDNAKSELLCTFCLRKKLISRTFYYLLYKKLQHRNMNPAFANNIHI